MDPRDLEYPRDETDRPPGRRPIYTSAGVIKC